MTKLFFSWLGALLFFAGAPLYAQTAVGGVKDSGQGAITATDGTQNPLTVDLSRKYMFIQNRSTDGNLVVNFDKPANTTGSNHPIILTPLQSMTFEGSFIASSAVYVSGTMNQPFTIKFGK